MASSFASGRFEKWLIFLLFVAGVLAVSVTAGDMGMCWDEPYYIDIGQRTSNWIRATLSSGAAPVRGEALDAYWREPEGHPSIPRFLAAAGWITNALRDGNTSYGALGFMRFNTAILFGLTLVMLFLLVRRTNGRVTAWYAAAAYFLMPRIFGHAHFAVTETPMILMTVLVIYAFLRGLDSALWAIATGIFFGIALATKINALLLPVILLPWAFLFYRRSSASNIHSMLFLGPLTMVLVWPWLWDKTAEHLLDYLRWNFVHPPIRVLYFGAIYDAAPWHYPVVMTALTVPLITLGLAILGIARCIRSPQKHYYGLLYLWAALVPMLGLMASAAKYDGIRLFIPAFPFIAALAGMGGGALVRVAKYFERPDQRFPFGKIVTASVLIAIVGNGGWALLSARPYYLTYFNSLIGGTKGAYARGMETAYWCEALNPEALERIDAAIPDGSTLMPLAFNNETLKHYQEWGLLKKSIQIMVDRGPVDYHLLQYRRGSFARPEWTLFEDYVPVLQIGPPGAPMFGLYQTGPEFERRWPLKPRR